MKFKKIAAATMAGAMALGLAACGGSNTASASTAAGAATSEAAVDSDTSGAVSYTHLDVYKRQALRSPRTRAETFTKHSKKFMSRSNSFSRQKGCLKLGTSNFD